MGWLKGSVIGARVHVCANSHVYYSDRVTFANAEGRRVVICPDNYLLSALPSAEYHRLIHDQQLVPLAAGDVICESGATSEYVYFPTTSVISLMYAMEDGSSPEIGLVGNEGMVDVARFLGGETAQNRAVVTIAGGALKMKSRALQSEFARGGPLQRLLLRYTQALITQIAQIAACNGLHTVEKRLGAS